MNPDQLKPGERSASTSNRNFEGRQGKGGRTHLVSPETAAAAAIAGRFVDIRKWPDSTYGSVVTTQVPTKSARVLAGSGFAWPAKRSKRSRKCLIRWGCSGGEQDLPLSSNEAFKSHCGKIATLDRANVDTDQIIPKQFLKSIRRTGFGENLFFDWRYLPDGKPNPSFELNRPEFFGATILITRNNFGCGSSREHAVWALTQYGFRVIIAPRRGETPAFADIFHTNSVKNGLLNVELKESEVEEIFRMAARSPGLEATIHLAEQRVTLHLPEEISFHFEIDRAVKEHLIRGLDEIGLTLQQEQEITRFEKKGRSPS